jgi:thiamine pyrophosphate-dependent acetolactate synthase large subunit-like protein
MASPKTSGGSALVAQLESIGVEVVFGIPGVHNLAIFEALDRSSIRTIVVRHEQAAGYAADGYARATGRLGVCVTTTGPGAANAAAAMGEARMSRSPVLHISTQLDTRSLEGRTGRFQLHEATDQLEMMRAVCRWAGRVQREDAIGQMVVRAAREAFTGRRGPAFLEIPFDLLATDTTRSPETGVRLIEPVAPDPDQLARALARLERAKNPVIWAGGGVISSGASEELAAFAEVLDAPVVTTFSGKGAIPSTHPLAVPFPPHQPEVTKLLADAGTVVIIGSDLDGMSTQGWRLPLARPRVAINVVGEDARRNYGCESLIEADARLTLEALLKELPAPTPTRGATPGAKRAAAVRKAAAGRMKKSKEYAEPFRFVERLRAAVPEDAFVLADMAVTGYWMAGYLPATQPRSFAYPLGWGTLGFAFPASEASCSRPASSPRQSRRSSRSPCCASTTAGTACFASTHASASAASSHPICTRPTS